MIGSSLKRLGFSVLLAIVGGVLGWISFGGLSQLWPIQFALPLAIVITVLYGVCCHFAAKTGSLFVLSLAVAMFFVVDGADGLAFSELLNHEDGDRVAAIATGADATVQADQLASAKADLSALDDRIDALSAEIGALRASASPEARAMLQAEIAAMDSDGKRSNDHLIPAKREHLEAMAATLATVAGKEAQLQTILGRREIAAESVTQLQGSALEARAEAITVADSGHFIFHLASQLAGGNPVMTSAILTGVGMILFGILEAVFGCLCGLSVTVLVKPAPATQPESAPSAPPSHREREREPESIWEMPDFSPDLDEEIALHGRNNVLPINPVAESVAKGEQEKEEDAEFAELDLPERLAKMTFEEICVGLSRGDEDKLIRRLNQRGLLERKFTGYQINKMPQEGMRDILHSTLRKKGLASLQAA